jgi:hypothetical protein
MSRARGDAEFYQSHKDDVEEWGEAERGEPAERLSVVISVRLTPEQEDRLRVAARRKDLSISTYLRESALLETGAVVTPTAVSSSTVSVSSSTVSVGGVDMTLPTNDASTAAA